MGLNVQRGRLDYAKTFHCGRGVCREVAPRLRRKPPLEEIKGKSVMGTSQKWALETLGLGTQRQGKGILPATVLEIVFWDKCGTAV